ncbi:EMC3/TMCO1 family protein [Methanobrevibacter filiformis]|uniref:DUF106 domain-containing protein n=1 Tax=Methanobrevibacter filiformis TaxID=55758 RepID=A0A165ZHS2_9EURY|nr:EMC3/TMCO1 family protein [Methanobrevibacter filiformis]KZX10746.1 hypothetical protein MBFIL_16580 [Methanobrevibacter filiformis]
MVLEIIFGALNSIFNPIIAIDPDPSNPLLTIFLISTIISLITTVANKLLVNHDEMDDIREEMKEFQNRMREAQKSGDAKAIAKMQNEQKDFMKKQSDMMKMSFKPLIVTFVPILLIFYWMGQASLNSAIASFPPFVFYVLLVPVWRGIYAIFTNPVVVTTVPYAVGWLGWYILCTFTVSQILRKAFGLKSGM